MYGINGAPAFRSRGISSDSSSERFDMSRPSARSIYMQRKEYSESMKRQPDMFLYRVEHLITCELDGREMGSVDDCVAKLKNLDSRGKVWGQGMILQVQNANLQLCDIETKEVLESVPLGVITKTFSILDSCSYDSVLAIITQGTSRRPPNVLLFQCEEAGAEEVSGDLERVMQHRDDDDSVFQPHEAMFDIRRNLENIIGQGHPGGFHRSAPPPSPPPPEYPVPQGNYRDYEDVMPQYAGPPHREEPRYIPEQNHQPPPSPTVEQDAEIFNHVAADIELFVGKVAEALQREDNKKKKKKKKTVWTYGVNIPSIDEFVACLQKFKYAFNLLANLNGHLKNPSPAEFVHSLFSSLGFVVKEYPPNVPSLVVSPLMIKPALDMLRDMLTPEEKMLWSTLGDAWHLQRSDWRNGDVPPYIPVFYDGWQPPMPVPPQSAPLRSNGQRVPAMNGVQQQAGQDNRGFGAPPARSSEPPLYMRVIYDFTARNRQELSVMKGEVVQVMDKSRQWWIVRNNRDEEGHVPQNVLEPVREEEPPRMNRAPNLNMGSSPEEVRAWLQYKGFSKSTVRTLGMMPGSVLLGMRREDIRAVCPEDGGRVCFQLQAVKSAMALASEGEYNQYGGR